STASIPPASNSRLSPLPPKPVGFSYEREATIDIPLDIASGGSRNQDLKKKEKELQAKEADLRREQYPCNFHWSSNSMQEVRRKEEAVVRDHSSFCKIFDKILFLLWSITLSIFALNYNLTSLFCSWSCLGREKLATIFPIIHHDIANEIPIHLQRLQYVLFSTYLGV
ncbi:hypothetical protein Godav_013498, partial [Gossypium davidsonii]|nr:hypothetical protein [Gossypium davidsonii]